MGCSLQRAQLSPHARRRLVAAFGSTRRKRQLDAKETGKVGSDNVAAEVEVAELLAKAGDAAAAAHATKARTPPSLIRHPWLILGLPSAL